MKSKRMIIVTRILKKLPSFKNEAEESTFWDEHDVTEYFDMSKVKPARFSSLKKTTKELE